MPYNIPKDKSKAPEVSNSTLKKIKSAAGNTKANTVRKFAHIFNSYMKRSRDEGRAFQIALGSLKNK